MKKSTLLCRIVSEIAHFFCSFPWSVVNGFKHNGGGGGGQNFSLPKPIYMWVFLPLDVAVIPETAFSQVTLSQ